MKIMYRHFGDASVIIILLPMGHLFDSTDYTIVDLFEHEIEAAKKGAYYRGGHMVPIFLYQESESHWRL